MRSLPSLDLIGGPAEGQMVVVTGPTSGIGKETAAALAARGAHGGCAILVGLSARVALRLPGLLPLFATTPAGH